MLRAILAVAALLWVPDVLGQPSRASSGQCLKCHDGSAAVAVNRQTSHVWSVDYRQARALGRIRLRDPRLPAVANLLVDGFVECTSCHSTHDEPTDTPYRLRYKEAQRTLCLTCHIFD